MPEGNCAKFVQSLSTAYTVCCNLRHGRHGNLLDGRYKAKLVERAAHGWISCVNPWVRRRKQRFEIMLSPISGADPSPHVSIRNLKLAHERYHSAKLPVLPALSKVEGREPEGPGSGGAKDSMPVETSSCPAQANVL
jgi:hypothetical protein